MTVNCTTQLVLARDRKGTNFLCKIMIFDLVKNPAAFRGTIGPVVASTTYISLKTRPLRDELTSSSLVKVGFVKRED